MVPIVTIASLNGKVNVAISGSRAVSWIARCPTNGEVGRNCRMKSAPVRGASVGVLMQYLLLSLVCCPAAVDDLGTAGNGTGGIRAEIGSELRDLSRFEQATDSSLGYHDFFYHL